MLTLHESIIKYLRYLEAMGKLSTVRTTRYLLTRYHQALTRRGVTPITATTADVESWLPSLGHLARSSKATNIHVVRGFHQWLERRGHRSDDPTTPIQAPKISRRTVAKDHLSLQEAQAYMETASALAEEETGRSRRAIANRNLAMLAVALATGRRRSGLCALQLTDMDLQREELRVSVEKGRPGRVLPIAAWACRVVSQYLQHDWVIMQRGRQTEALFPGVRSDYVGTATFAHWLIDLQPVVCARNPDLEDLPKKRISTHSLRVTFATALFEGGCNLRSLNELMLHQKLSTTAAYTPVPVEALRSVLLTAHPRAS